MYDGHSDTSAAVELSASSSSSRLADLLRGKGRNLGLLGALLIALLILAIYSPRYFTFNNFVVVALQMAFIGIASLGTAHLIISGNVDLSIGAIFAISAVLAANLAKVAPPIVALIGGILLAGLLGFINGAMVWRIKLSPIIITLGSLTALRGIVLLVTGGYAVRGVPDEFSAFGQARPLDIPMPVWILLLLAVVAHIILHTTTVGRHVFAIGGNRDASEAAGINVRRMVLSTFTVNGLIVGLAAVLAASRYGTASPSFGVGYEFDVITAVILGGVAFTGGEGNVVGVILAVILLGVINSGLVALGVDPHYTEIVKGLALILAVSLDQLAHERQASYRTMLAMRERDRS